MYVNIKECDTAEGDGTGKLDRVATLSFSIEVLCENPISLAQGTREGNITISPQQEDVINNLSQRSGFSHLSSENPPPGSIGAGPSRFLWLCP